VGVGLIVGVGVLVAGGVVGGAVVGFVVCVEAGVVCAEAGVVCVDPVVGTVGLVSSPSRVRPGNAGDGPPWRSGTEPRGPSVAGGRELAAAGTGFREASGAALAPVGAVDTSS
jgi:hypothetical protein